jgi:hypothetical protein
MRSRQVKLTGAALAGVALAALSGCTSDDMAMFAEGMAMAADEMSVTMTMVPAYGCDYNVDGYLVCDDTGDGFADRYGDSYDTFAPVTYVPAPPPVRVNGWGEAYQYNGACDCWAREPSLDEGPPSHHDHHDDDWDD